MDIKTKYNIGDRVWIVYEARISNKYINNEPAGEVSVYDDTISSIEIGKEGIVYLLKNADFVDLKEDEIILYDETDKLLAKIQELMNEINEREKEDESN